MQQVFQKSSLVVTILEAFFELGTDIMDNPGEAKFGMTRISFLKLLPFWRKKSQDFWDSLFPSIQYRDPSLLSRVGASAFFELAVEIKEKLGISLDFINLSGGIGVNYRPDQEPNDIAVIGEGVRKVYEEVLTTCRSWSGQNFLLNWVVLCWRLTELWSQESLIRKKPTVPIWAWMHQQSTSCAQPCTELPSYHQSDSSRWTSWSGRCGWFTLWKQW